MISVAAELAGVHPQTLRIYERKGLLRPKRTAGQHAPLLRGGHRAACARSRRLTQDEGINLAGREADHGDARADGRASATRGRAPGPARASPRDRDAGSPDPAPRWCPLRTVIRLPWEEVALTEVRLVRLRLRRPRRDGAGPKGLRRPPMGYPDAFGPPRRRARRTDRAVRRVRRYGVAVGDPGRWPARG